MRILRIRPGFQADHSSSSYLFYATGGDVSAAGQRVARRFSSSADVDGPFARYQKWGDYELSTEAFPALLGAHYDVMASESYDSWTLMIAVPKTRQMTELLRPFHNLDDGEFVRLDVHDYGKQLAIKAFCEFDYGGPLLDQGEDLLETLVELLATIRTEIVQGDVSFLRAVADFYGADREEEEEESPAAEPPRAWTKVELQHECVRRGVSFQKSWTKDHLRQALTAAKRSRPPTGATRGGKPAKLSRAARRIVASLEHR